ncbi:Arabinanase/levansucrase/invertase [Schizophyllum commune H4-8]|nr:Arabinanase/levansucrase/invertase [Schizophyllum commune H4-8]KAI5892026.1 Arabinanase/levansucrase/invertase [Schizophyllum commune H4-8]
MIAFLSGLLLATVALAAPAKRQSSADAYGFIYFTGESHANGEQIYFAVSDGNTPGAWKTVNNASPVLTSTLGDKGVRDPFIIRHPETGTFYVVATDLKMYGSGRSWDQASRTGSLSLAIWESDDLVNWSEERLVKVSPPEAGMTWAPEARWDAEEGVFNVYWASALYNADDTNHTGSSYSRQMIANTTDFNTFTEPQVWLDYGSSTIDTTAIFDDASGYWHRFTKFSAYGPSNFTGVVQTRARPADFFANDWELVFQGIGDAEFGQVEGPLVFKDNVEANTYHVWVDKISPQGYEPFSTNDISSGTWTYDADYVLPDDPRHGTVFAISASEAEALSSIGA